MFFKADLESILKKLANFCFISLWNFCKLANFANLFDAKRHRLRVGWLLMVLASSQINVQLLNLDSSKPAIKKNQLMPSIFK